jgi:MFS family permease
MVLATTDEASASMPAFFALGFSLTFAATSTNATIQRQCPEHVRGGLVGMYGMAYNGTMPFGYLLVGTASEALGVRHTFAAMAMVLAVGVISIVAWQQIKEQRQGAE